MTKAPRTIPMFPAPEKPLRTLSTLYSGPIYRASPDMMPVWTTIKTKNPIECDECFANQHETMGKSGPRSRARSRRRFPKGTRLDLCREHEELWKRRDAVDCGTDT